MTDLADFPAQLEKSFSGVEQKVEECRQQFQALIDTVNNWRIVLGVPVMWWISQKIKQIREALQKVIQLARTARDHYAPVIGLIVQAFNWIDNVKNPMNGLAHQPGNLPYYWEGTASTAYQAKVATQNEAIGVVATKAGEIGKWLMEIAKYNTEYMTELLGMLTEVAGALVKAVINAGTVVNIPFAVSDVADLVGSLVEKSLTHLVGIINRLVEALSKTLEVRGMMSDIKLPGGKWPQAITG
ncbi:hypothetical protein [Lentzea flava]|uniref:Proteins of 100 residues with WXG n=1 Tax=Lentzea flava TaxID=103732 RepID=A0ABQ2V336_9PSEU|nr:hypothetical protein [Lentzea flava]MCP2203250.1 hypothetical protein [Lentzea flava]GGU66761.1 hypothetical protein GCM10010178_68270 [Lentzea flava]